ncbi:AAA family ATPase [Streptomyces sp. C3-3]|uniref:AAA family ATPase n=1 Tax=Streptomyces sp. C3-3 TaxID=2824901 RepID=UPI001FFCE8F3|nr:AAA family ATPase [Streptomyces sp. C3-3]
MEPTLPLFDEEPSRPLADRLRPTRLDEVVGQDHLLAPDAPLGRMVAAQRLSSAILWGPPGVGKTTIARLLAHAGTWPSNRSRPPSPASPTCAKSSPPRKAGAPSARAPCCSSTRSTASTAPSRTASCPTSRTARSP